jgi:hypothetical protein
MVVADGYTMFPANNRLKVMYLCLLWRRRMPELFDGGGAIDIYYGRHNRRN